MSEEMTTERAIAIGLAGLQPAIPEPVETATEMLARMTSDSRIRLARTADHLHDMTWRNEHGTRARWCSKKKIAVEVEQLRGALRHHMQHFDTSLSFWEIQKADDTDELKIVLNALRKARKLIGDI